LACPAPGGCLAVPDSRQAREATCDHVAGADPAVHAGRDGPYHVHTTFHQPLVLYRYLAAVTSTELVTGIIIVPQRQTALVAKQAAEAGLRTVQRDLRPGHRGGPGADAGAAADPGLNEMKLDFHFATATWNRGFIRFGSVLVVSA
jgi:hypothetical protein